MLENTVSLLPIREYVRGMKWKKAPTLVKICITIKGLSGGGKAKNNYYTIQEIICNNK